MKRILLVDDEPLARQHIRERFPWTEWGFEIIGEASNGVDALQKCAELKPDIALIDITMPVMDGLELLKRLNSDYPSIRSIILTVNREFHFVQEAIRNGALGYILKSPVNLEETKAALDRVSTELDKETTLHETQQSHQSLLRNYQYPLRKKFFDNILTRVLSGDEEICNRGVPLGIHLEAQHYNLVYCRVDQLDLFKERYPVKDQPLIEFSLLEIVRETLQGTLSESFELFPLSFGQFVIIFTYFDSDHCSYQSTVNRAASALKDPLSHYLKLQLSLSVTAPFKSLSQINEHYRHAEQLQIQRFYMKDARPIFTESMTPIQHQFNEKTEQLFIEFPQLFTDGSFDGASNWCEKLKTYTIQYKTNPVLILKKLQSLKDTTRANTSVSDEMLPWPNYHVAVSIYDAARMLLDYLERWEKLSRQLHVVRPEISQAIQYIKSHLHEDLSLNSIAEHVELSPSYLGHLFKHEIGSSIINYVLEERINQAKAWLASGQYRSYELAEKVGFRSYSYFCTMFKKHTGMTPNEYKQRSNQPILLNREK